MFQKFIIDCNGTLRFGKVYLHRDLLKHGERCIYGGGLWKVDNSRGAIVLYGRSFDFGTPDFAFLKRIDWSYFGDAEHPLLYLPHWPDETQVIPIIIGYNGVGIY